MKPLLEQREDQFAYRVVSRALDRSADGNRFLDTLFFALIAAQAAIFAIVLDKIHEYPAFDWTLMLAGVAIALSGAGLSLLVADGPDPEEFAAEFPSDPRATRHAHIDDFVIKAYRNARLGIIKIFALVLAAALTLVSLASLVVATAGRATGV